MKVAKKVDQLYRKIEDIHQQIRDLQSGCQHEHVTLKPGSNTGNWDGFDSYWFDIKCHDCQKYWHEDQENSSYHIHGDPRVVKVVR